MRYIQKDFGTQVIAQHNRELRNQGLDRESLIHRKQTESLKADELYDQIRSRDFIPHLSDVRNQLNAEQGGVCCYCGMKLQYPDSRHYSLEHVLPRSLYPELVGEYSNLLLSCHASDVEQKKIKQKVHRRKDRQLYLHCDEAKEAQILYHTPLDEDCETFFRYKLSGEVEGTDEHSNADIETLHLNCDYLKNRRRALILSALFSDNEPLSDDLLEAYRNRVLQRDANGNFDEFYFVKANMAEQLLQKR